MVEVKYCTNNAGHFDAVIFGATAFASGLAYTLSKSGKKCLIFDRYSLIAHEFSSAMKDSAAHTVPSTKYGKELYTRMCRRGAVNSQGKTHIAAITPSVCELLDDSNVIFYPMTVADSIEKTDNKWKLSLISIGRKTNLTADMLFDTSSDLSLGSLISENNKPKAEKASINAALLPPPDYSGKGFSGNCFEIVTECLKNEFIGHFYFGDDVVTARRELKKFITEKPTELSGWSVMLFADELDITLSDNIPEYSPSGILCLPSCRYLSATAAFDAGCAKAETIIFDKTPYIANDHPISASDDVDEGAYDIAVVGMGTAGAIAAISAAKKGMRVLGLENLNCPGGSATAGGIYPFYLGYHGGEYIEIDKQTAKLASNGFTAERGEGINGKALILDEITNKINADTRFGATFTNVIHDENNDKKIVGLYWIENGVRHYAKTKFIIDATAEGTVSVNAGCKMQGGRELDGGYQLFSVVSRYYNLKTMVTGSRNCDDGRVDQYDPAGYGKALIHAYRSELHLPEKYNDDKLITFGPAPLPGIREGAKIIGEETVTLHDLIANGSNFMPAFFEYANLDNHGKDTAFEDRSFRDLIEVCSLWSSRFAVPIPVGALIPKHFDGIIVCGRALAVDHGLSFAVRMKDSMQKSGQAAAALAANAIISNISAVSVDRKMLCNEMAKCGVLGINEKFCINYYENGEGSYKNDTVRLTNDLDKLKKQLSGNSGGSAILAVVMQKDSFLSTIQEWHNESDGESYLKLNCALALCLMGDEKTSEKTIISAIKDKSGKLPSSSHTYNIPYAVAAMSAAGHCGMIAAVPALLEVISTPYYADDIEIHDAATIRTKMFRSHEDMRLAYYSTSLASLADICELHPEICETVYNSLPDKDADNIISLSFTGRDASDRECCALQLNELRKKIKCDM